MRIFYPADKAAAEKHPPATWLPDSYGRARGYAEAYASALFRPGVNATLVGTLGFVPLMSNVKTQTGERCIHQACHAAHAQTHKHAHTHKL